MSTIRPVGPCPAKIMIVGEFPGVQEEQQGAPFVGWAGQELSKMLSEAGIFRGACFVTSVVRLRPPGNNIDGFIARRKMDVTKQHIALRDKMVLAPVVEGLELLKREIEMCRPNIIIALGNVAFWALTGNWGITSWRGSTVQTDLKLALDYQPKVIGVYNPAVVMRQWSWRQVCVQDFRRALKESSTPDYSKSDYRFITRPDYTTALQYLDLLQRAVGAKPTKLAVDIETRAGHIACLGIAWSPHEAICFPLMCVERPEGYWSFEQEVEICLKLAELLCHPNAVVIGQNFSYDAQYIQRWLRFTPRLIRDTMLAQHSCFSTVQKSLDFLSSMYCQHHVYWKDDGKTWDEGTGEDQLWSYNCEDAVKTWEVDEVEQAMVTSMKLQPVHDFQQKLFWPVLRTMNRGIRVAKERRGEFAMTLSDEIAARQQWLIDVLGYELNPASPPQMQDLFYKQLNFKEIRDRKSGSVTCNSEALNKLAGREPLCRPLVRKIEELRSLNVFLSTFVNAPLDRDGRLRCSFNIAGTETYRFASSKNAFGSGMNLQNIPAGGETESGELELPNVRTLFIPDQGYEFFDTDLSSADLHIVMWEADDPEAKAILRSGEDFYTVVGREFYKDPSFSKKDPRRNQFFKPFCHGTNYLGTAKGLAERLGISVHEAERTQKWYFGKFKKVRDWHQDLTDQVHKRRMVQNVFGYRNYIFDRIEGTLMNEVVAWIPQSTIACLINRVYMRLYEEAPEIEVLLQVHDSLAGQYPIHRRDWAKARILELGKIPLPYNDPLTIGMGIKTSTVSWGDCA